MKIVLSNLILLLLGLSLFSCGTGSNKSRSTEPVTDSLSVAKPSAADSLAAAIPAPTQIKIKADSTATNNVITDPNHTLKCIYEKLYSLKSNADGSKTTLSIIHIGDSHLQAGFLNGTVMKLLQREFGNAGRGVIFPLKLAKTNEPTDYFIESTEPWNAARCVTRHAAFPVGLGGLSIMTQNNDFAFRVGTEDRDNIDYTFNKLKIFHHAKSPALNAKGIDGAKVIRDAQSPFMTELDLPSYVHSLNLSSEPKQVGDSAIIYGFSLERSDPGVIYHAIGINAAQFSSYLRISDFADQINALCPDLIIFSLGTNEAFNDAINKKAFSKNVDSLVSSLVRKIPHTKVIISTPAECQRRYNKYGDEFRPNELIPEVSETLIEYANQKGYPYWDLFNITGGKNSSQWWIQHNYLAKDRIHFYVSGYKYQGELLYQALINGYNDYVSTRAEKG